MFGENQSAQALAATPSRTEALLKTAGVALGLRGFLSLPIDRGVSQADHHASNRAQDSRRSWSAHSALIFPQRHIQAMVQPAFDHPIASLDAEHPPGLDCFQSKAAHQKNHFTAPLAVPFDPRL
jgi:hypothetical protein